MQTVTGPNSLITAKQTLNRSNIFVIDDMFFKENYHNVFASISNLYQSGKTFSKFTETWYTVCADECKAVRNKLRDVLNSRKPTQPLTTDEKDMIERVVVKFRGNLGEIFAEAFFTEGFMAHICKPTAYDPVDPNNERYTDATSISARDGLPIGIQIKNYNKFAESAVSAREIFDKACVSYLRACTETVKPEDIIRYMSQPRQIVFTFTELANDLLMDEYNKYVIVFGPKDIDAKGLQGNAKKKLTPNWLFFKTIADKILSVNKS